MTTHNPNTKSIYVTLGASNHTNKVRQHEDYYATDPVAAEWLLRIEDIPRDQPIWECAAGENHLANVFRKHGYSVRTSDLIQRTPTTEPYNFLSNKEQHWHGSIITNPPYQLALEFIVKALSMVDNGCLVAMFLKVQFLEGKERRKLFDAYPPQRIWVSSSRILCAKNGEFERMRAAGGSAVAYAWYIWRKGNKGETTLKWFN